jgi:hypothetical protein
VRQLRAIASNQLSFTHGREDWNVNAADIRAMSALTLRADMLQSHRGVRGSQGAILRRGESAFLSISAVRRDRVLASIG